MANSVSAPVSGTLGSALSSSVQGLQDAAGRANKAAQNIAQGPVSIADTTRDIVDLSQAETSFAANAAVIRTVDETQDRLLDILA